MTDRARQYLDHATGAILSNDRRYRYRLWRTWDASAPTVTFVVSNPNPNDELDRDPTCQACVDHAERWGFGSLVVVALFALRSSNPAAFRHHPDPVGPKNDEHLRRACEEANLVVAAWGDEGSIRDRDREVLELLDADLHCVGLTPDEHPAPPRSAPDVNPEPWEGRERLVRSRDG